MIQRIGLVVAAVLVLVLTFTLGVLVGRQGGRPAASPVATTPNGPPERPAPAPRRSALAEPAARPAREPEEKLTFYRTLTAPLGPAGRPAGETRGTPPPASPRGAAPAPWTVQVGAFKNEGQAEALSRGLARGGYPAVVAVGGAESASARYRVRVGSYHTRADAERMAERLRAERRLATYVTAP